MALKVSVHSASGAYKIKKIVEERENVLSIKREIDGSDNLIKVDLTNIPAGLHYNKQSADTFENLVKDNLWGIRRLTHESNINVNIAGQITGSPVPKHDDNDYYHGIYPRYIFVGAGETVALDTGNGVVPSWIPTQTNDERTAKIRISKANNWERRLHKVAVEFDSEDLSRKWAQHAGKYERENPEVGLNLNRRNADHLKELSKIDNTSIHRCQLLGVAFRIVRLYRNTDNANAFHDATIAAWAAGAIAQGDYRTHSDKTWIAKSAHTAAESNKPGTEGGNAVWKEAKLDGAPTLFHDGSKLTGLNISTGDGIEEFVSMMESQFDVSPRDHFNLAGKYEALWSDHADSRIIYTMNPDTGLGQGKIYEATINPHDNSSKTQRQAALLHSKADWYDLYARFIDALDYKTVLEPHELKNQKTPAYAQFHHNMMMSEYPLP